MKTVKRKTPGAGQRRRRVKVEAPEEPKAPKEEKRPPGTPSPTTWLTLGEKQQRAARLAKRLPTPALDPSYDERALEALRGAAGFLQADGWHRYGEEGAGWTLSKAISSAAFDINVTLRAFHLVEEAIERIFPEKISTTGRTMGVIWLNDHYATCVGDVLFVLEEVLAEPALAA